MFERFFELSKHGTNVRTELLAGLTTFLTMSYIIVVQPMVLAGDPKAPTGMDFNAITVATCISAAVATAIMGLYGRYPIAQAPGMGENFFFVTSILPAAATLIASQVAAGTLKAGEVEPWQVGLGVIFLSGILFILITLAGLREVLLEAISPSLRNAIAVGIGLFIALIGVKSVALVVFAHDMPALNHQFQSPDLIVFFFGLAVTAGLFAMRVRGAIFWGIAAATLLTIGMKLSLPYLPDKIAKSDVVANSMLVKQFQMADGVFSTPPSMAPTFLKMDLVRAVSWPMAPLVLIVLFMVVFDTLGTLVGVGEQAGLIKDNKLPRAREALLSDAVGSLVGAACGTSTVTSFIESAAGVEQGGRTGLTALTAAVLFLLALFFQPLIVMVGSYPSITAPALVVVGSMMMRHVTKIDWDNYAEALPAFLTILGIPLSYSIADGLALGFISYPVLKLLSGQGRQVRWLTYVLAVVLVAYFVAASSWVKST